MAASIYRWPHLFIDGPASINSWGRIGLGWVGLGLGWGWVGLGLGWVGLGLAWGWGWGWVGLRWGWVGLGLGWGWVRQKLSTRRLFRIKIVKIIIFGAKVVNMTTLIGPKSAHKQLILISTAYFEGQRSLGRRETR